MIINMMRAASSIVFEKTKHVSECPLTPALSTEGEGVGSHVGD